MFLERIPAYMPTSSSVDNTSNEKRYQRSGGIMKNNGSNQNAQPEWLTRLLGELSYRLNMVVKYTCCLPLSLSGDLYGVKTRPQKRTTFNIPPSVTVLEEVPPSPAIPQSIEPAAIPAVNPRVGSKTKRRKKILKNLLKKLRKRQLDASVDNGPLDKCCGECIPIHAVRSLDSNPYDESSSDEDSLPDVSGDGPQKRQNRRRISGFFNDIYNFGR